jgi:hypothetical protein
MAISYIYPANGEPVTREPWVWVAFFDDGTKLEQFELSSNGPIFHRSSEISEHSGRLTELHFEHPTYSRINIVVPENADPVHFYRHRNVHEVFPDPDRPEGSDDMLSREWKTKIWVLGFRIGKQFWLAYADEYGTIVYSADDQLFRDKLLDKVGD